MKTFSLKKVVILAIMLTMPALLYYLLQEKGKNRYRPLGIFGPKTVTSTFHIKRGKQIPDTIYHIVRDFKLINQDNHLVSFPSDSNKLTVVAFFYTRCPLVCSGINKKMAEVVRIYQKNKLLQFLSITVDPHFDTSEELKKYSKEYQVQPNKWNFLTGDEAAIYKLAKEDFLVDVLKDTTQNNNIIHRPMLILLDPQKRIRGYYNSIDKEQVDRLIDEIRVFIAEELRNVKDR